jgi:hypothetical protein
VKPLDLTIGEIKGSWEGIFPLFIGYCRLEIDSNGDGYFVIVFKEDNVEVLKIKSISISGREIHINLSEIEDDGNQSTIMKGVVWSDRMLLEVVSGNETSASQEKMEIRFMRDSSFNSCREMAMDKINELNKK